MYLTWVQKNWTSISMIEHRHRSGVAYNCEGDSRRIRACRVPIHGHVETCTLVFIKTWCVLQISLWLNLLIVVSFEGIEGTVLEPWTN
jgi:hypothetical protein